MGLVGNTLERLICLGGTQLILSNMRSLLADPLMGCKQVSPLGCSQKVWPSAESLISLTAHPRSQLISLLSDGHLSHLYQGATAKRSEEPVSLIRHHTLHISALQNQWSLMGWSVCYTLKELNGHSISILVVAKKQKRWRKWVIFLASQAVA